MKTPTTVAKRHQRAKITSADVEAIAKLLVCRRLTETEACLHLGILPGTWFTWKCNPANASRNSEALARVRAAWVDSRCKSIEEVGDGAPGTRRDWRAQAWMLERTLPDRFNSQPEAAPAPPPMLDPRTIEILLSAAYKFAKPEPEPGRVIVAEEVKALPAPTDPDPLPAKVRMPPIKPPDGRL